MASYLILSPTWLCAVGRAHNEMHPAGSVVAFAGNPGVSMFPLDDEARAARHAVIQRRNRSQRESGERAERAVLGFRAALGPKTVVAQLDAAMAEFAQWRAEHEAQAKGVRR